MPLWLWVGIVVLSLSVAIPAINRLVLGQKRQRTAKEQERLKNESWNLLTEDLEDAAKEAQLSGSQARLLWHFEAEGRGLERFLTSTLEKWNYSGEHLVHPLSVDKSDWKNSDSDQAFSATGMLRDFKCLCANHMTYVQLEFPGLQTPLLELGYPSNAESSEVMFAIRDHCDLLNETAERIWSASQPMKDIDAKNN
jgi:hypothetical protein